MQSKFATSLSVYYLPRLTELHSRQELRKEVFSVYKLVMPLLVLFSVMLFAGRDLVIHVLFTNEFAGMRDLFTFQVLGDFFKLSSWVLAYMLIAKSMTRTYIIMEFVSSIAQVGFSLFFFNMFGTVGATMGYACGHLLYFICMIYIFRKIVFLRPQAGS